MASAYLGILLSVRTRSNRIGLLVGLLAGFLGSAAAAQPVELFECLSSPESFPTCEDIGGGVLFTECPARFYRFYGRIAWFPLRCVGPITVGVKTAGFWSTRFPLYVEVVPLRQNPGVCVNDPGYVVMIARGGFAPCGTWETVGPVDITTVIPVGSSYALRLRFFGAPGGDSPGVDCVRVTPHLTGVTATTWGQVKCLFK